MTLTLISGPDLPLSLAEIKAIARLDGVDESDDALVIAHARAAVDHLDGPDGVLGRALMRQVWQLTLDCFPPLIKLPLPPLAGVLIVSYLDVVGDPQVVAPIDYIVAGVGGDGSIRPAPGSSWPSTRAVPEAVTVVFAAGAEDWNGVPEALRMAIGEMVRNLYDGCDLVTPAVHDLVAPYRAYWSV